MKGGGTAILASTNTPTTPLYLVGEQSIETAGVTLYTNNREISIFSAYFPPNLGLQLVELHLENIKNASTNPFITIER